MRVVLLGVGVIEGLEITGLLQTVPPMPNRVDTRSGEPVLAFYDSY